MLKEFLIAKHKNPAVVCLSKDDYLEVSVIIWQIIIMVITFQEVEKTLETEIMAKKKKIKATLLA